MKFTKMQGAGNDFVLVEAGNSQRDWSELAVDMCDRHFGVGADGLLILLPSDRADFRMRIFNADGSESSACGNGLRCMVKYFMDSQVGNKRAAEISVETMAGIRIARIRKTDGEVAEIQVEMGKPGIGQENAPVEPDREDDAALDIKARMSRSITVLGRGLDLFVVSMSNPHAILFTEEPVSEFPLSEIGPQVECYPEFPGRTNYEVVNVRSRNLVEARVWERGVGETLACGSGACAISVAAQLLGYVDRRVDVALPGGVLNVEWDGAGEVFLSGPAETVFSGEWL
ncbi:MAG: diaminopimelate epimerase [Dehalococcoidales bacterium]|nr:diaminopimelate epimerase [Dehalococcoidales bacterium]